MKEPLLSVCVITYNHAQYIKEALDSILSQKVDFEWELIIADDYSTDGTREILNEYKDKFPDLIKLILQKRNYGPEKNWLDLMEYPKSKYVLYTEGDDYMIDSDKLQNQVDFLEAHEDFSLCFHPVKVIYDDGSRPDEIFPSPEQRFNKNVLELNDLLINNFIQTNSVMYRWRFTQENIKDVFPKGITPGDWFLHILHAQVGKIGFMNKVMAVYRRHPGGLWWNSYRNIDEIWKKYGIAHLNLYVEFLKFYGDNPSYKKIIDEHIGKLMTVFAEVDNKYGSHLLRDALMRFPEIAETSIIYQQQMLEAKNQEITGLSKQLEDRIQSYDTLAKEVESIKNSKSWAIAQRLTRAHKVRAKNKGS